MVEINKMVKMGAGDYASDKLGIKNKEDIETGDIATAGLAGAAGGALAGAAAGAALGLIGGPLAPITSSLGAIAGALIGGIGGGLGMGGAASQGLLPDWLDFDWGGKKAKGGPVKSGTAYMVGENGPELFSPKTSGTIVPNNQIKSASELTAADIPKLLAELKGYDVSRDDAGMWSAAKKSNDGTSETINQFGTKTVSGGFGSITYDAKGNEISRSTPKLGGLQMSSSADGSTKQSYDFTSGPVQGKMEAVNGQGSKMSLNSGNLDMYSGLGGQGISYKSATGNNTVAGPKGGYDSLKDGGMTKGMMDTITNVFAGKSSGDATDPGQQTNNEMVMLLRELVSSQNRQVDTSDKLLQATYNN